MNQDRRLTLWPISPAPRRCMSWCFSAGDPVNSQRNKHSLQNRPQVTNPLKTDEKSWEIRWCMNLSKHSIRLWCMSGHKASLTRRQVWYFGDEELLAQEPQLVVSVQMFCHAERRGATAELLRHPRDRLLHALHHQHQLHRPAGVSAEAQTL